MFFLFACCWRQVAGDNCYTKVMFYEEGKVRETMPRQCGSINGWCIKAVYADEDSNRKQGYSKGCDQTDCETGDMIGAQLWDDDGCRNHSDYGNLGMICCCQGDLCNHATTAHTTTLSLIFLVAIAYSMY